MEEDEVGVVLVEVTVWVCDDSSAVLLPDVLVRARLGDDWELVVESTALVLLLAVGLEVFFSELLLTVGVCACEDDDIVRLVRLLLEGDVELELELAVESVGLVVLLVVELEVFCCEVAVGVCACEDDVFRLVLLEFKVELELELELATESVALVEIAVVELEVFCCEVVVEVSVWVCEDDVVCDVFVLVLVLEGEVELELVTDAESVALVVILAVELEVFCCEVVVEASVCEDDVVGGCVMLVLVLNGKVELELAADAESDILSVELASVVELEESCRLTRGINGVPVEL